VRFWNFRNSKCLNVVDLERGLIPRIPSFTSISESVCCRAGPDLRTSEPQKTEPLSPPRRSLVILGRCPPLFVACGLLLGRCRPLLGASCPLGAARCKKQAERVAIGLRPGLDGSLPGVPAVVVSAEILTSKSPLKPAASVHPGSLPYFWSVDPPRRSTVSRLQTPPLRLPPPATRTCADRGSAKACLAFREKPREVLRLAIESLSTWGVAGWLIDGGLRGVCKGRVL
jgi:hypothetical protein